MKNRTRTAADIGLGVILVAAMAVTALAVSASWGGLYWLVDCVTGTLLGVLALLRYRHYIASAAAGMVVALAAVAAARLWELPRQPGPAGIIALAVLAGAAIRRSTPIDAACTTAGGSLVVAAVAVFSHPNGGSTNLIAVLNALGLTAAVGIGLALRLMDSTRHTTADRVRRDERLELARELHDVAAHHLTSIVLHAQAARIVAQKRPAELDESLAEMENSGTEALAAMRRVVGLLREANDADSTRPVPERLRELVRRYEEHGPKVRLVLPGPGGDNTAEWAPEVMTTVYRVVQESLTNISRHAPNAGSVTVAVAQDERSIYVEITDDGPPPSARRPRRAGYGLLGMRERVEALGGTVTAGPRSPVGWSVRAVLPAAVTWATPLHLATPTPDLPASHVPGLPTPHAREAPSLDGPDLPVPYDSGPPSAGGPAPPQPGSPASRKSRGPEPAVPDSPGLEHLSTGEAR